MRNTTVLVHKLVLYGYKFLYSRKILNWNKFSHRNYHNNNENKYSKLKQQLVGYPTSQLQQFVGYPTKKNSLEYKNSWFLHGMNMIFYVRYNTKCSTSTPYVVQHFLVVFISNNRNHGGNIINNLNGHTLCLCTNTCATTSNQHINVEMLLQLSHQSHKTVPVQMINLSL